MDMSRTGIGRTRAGHDDEDARRCAARSASAPARRRGIGNAVDALAPSAWRAFLSSSIAAAARSPRPGTCRPGRTTRFRNAGLDVEVELIAGGDCAVSLPGHRRTRRSAVDRRRRRRNDQRRGLGGGRDRALCLASCRSARSTISRAISEFRATLDDAAQLIASGQERQVDVGEMNGRIFINNSAIGLYPLMVVDRDLQRKRLGRSKRAGDDRRIAADARALQSPPADAHRERRADRARRHAVAVRRQ